MQERFTDRMRKKAADIWEAQCQHPFVRGIGDGNLDLERFAFWLRQDYVFLIEYARLLALAAARSRELATMVRFADLLKETLETEMSLHRAYAYEFGISREQLEREQPAPTTQAYTDYLLRVAAMGDFTELVAAMLPCMWSFSEIGQQLATLPNPAQRKYVRWIAMYSSKEFAELAQWCRELVDELSKGLPEHALQKMENAFLTSSRYEWKVWEMAWNREVWPM